METSTVPTNRSNRLRQVLTLNAATSGASGLLAAFAPATVANLLGLEGSNSDLIIRVIGLGLIGFALEVAITARRASDRALPRWAGMISGADVAWVVATLVVVATIDLSAVGISLALAVGAGVGCLAYLQLRLRRA